MKLPPSKPNPELDAAIEKARHHVMTAEEKFEQRVSFVYGQQDFDKPARNKDEIRKHVAESIGFPLDEIAALRAEITALKASIADEREDAARAALECATGRAKNACLVPPDGGSPTDEEREMCDRAAEYISEILPKGFRSRQP